MKVAVGYEVTPTTLTVRTVGVRFVLRLIAIQQPHGESSSAFNRNVKFPENRFYVECPMIHGAMRDCTGSL